MLVMALIRDSGCDDNATMSVAFVIKSDEPITIFFLFLCFNVALVYTHNITKKRQKLLTIPIKI